MTRLIQLVIVGGFFSMIVFVFTFLVLTKLHAQWIDRTSRKIRKRREKLRMLREYREGRIK